MFNPCLSTQATSTIIFLWVVSNIVKFIESKCGMVVARGKGVGRGRRNREVLINGHKVSIKQDE